MKILLAFALVAAVTSSPPRLESIQLQAAPEPDVPEAGFLEPSFEPLFIPQDVVDAYARELELNPALETVQFADQPEDFARFEEWNLAVPDQIPEPIKFVDSEIAAEIPEASNVLLADQPEFDQSFVHPLAYAFDEAAAEEIPDAPSNVQLAEQPKETDHDFVLPLMYLEEPDVAAEELPEAPADVQFAEQPEETAAADLPESPANIQIADDFDQFFGQPLAVGVFDVVPAEESIPEPEVADSPVRFVEDAENAENPAPIDYQVHALEDDFQPQELPNPKLYDNDMVR